MEDQHPFGGLRSDVLAFLGQDLRQPDGLAGPFRLVDIDLASAAVEQDDPDQPGSNDEPDDEQPPVELGVHPREV